MAVFIYEARCSSCGHEWNSAREIVRCPRCEGSSVSVRPFKIPGSADLFVADPEKVRRLVEDMAALEAANPVPAEERLRRTIASVDRDIGAALGMIRDFVRWRSRRREAGDG